MKPSEVPAPSVPVATSVPDANGCGAGAREAAGRGTIRIRPSPTADTRTCDWSKVTRETLLASSEQHIRDVGQGLALFARLLDEAAARHDHDKISAIDHFHADFRTGFKATGWWDNHRKVNRHHLLEADGIPADVNLIDVLDHVVDCVMAGIARSGSVRPLALPPDLLQRAFANTVALLVAHVELATAPDAALLPAASRDPATSQPASAPTAATVPHAAEAFAPAQKADPFGRTPIAPEATSADATAPGDPRRSAKSTSSEGGR